MLASLRSRAVAPRVQIPCRVFAAREIARGKSTPEAGFEPEPEGPAYSLRSLRGPPLAGFKSTDALRDSRGYRAALASARAARRVVRRRSARGGI